MLNNTQYKRVLKSNGIKFLFGGVGAIVGSEKPIEVYGADAAVTKPEVPALHAGWGRRQT